MPSMTSVTALAALFVLSAQVSALPIDTPRTGIPTTIALGGIAATAAGGPANATNVIATVSGAVQGSQFGPSMPVQVSGGGLPATPIGSGGGGAPATPGAVYGSGDAGTGISVGGTSGAATTLSVSDDPRELMLAQAGGVPLAPLEGSLVVAAIVCICAVLSRKRARARDGDPFAAA